MYQDASDNIMLYRAHVVFDLNEILQVTPRLLAWGSILSLPKADIMKVACHVADILPLEFNEQSVDYYPIIDSVKDSIYYIFDDNPTDIPRPFMVDDTFQQNVYEYEADVITAGRYIKARLGAKVTFCKFVAFAPNNAFIVEIDYHE